MDLLCQQSTHKAFYRPRDVPIVWRLVRQEAQVFDAFPRFRRPLTLKRLFTICWERKHVFTIDQRTIGLVSYRCGSDYISSRFLSPVFYVLTTTGRREKSGEQIRRVLMVLEYFFLERILKVIFPSSPPLTRFPVCKTCVQTATNGETV